MVKQVNWHDFEAKIKDKKIPIFSSLDIRRLFGASKIASDLLLHRYSKKGYITRIKRGLYILLDTSISEFFIASKLYEPSYISLETALSYWGVIPETVYEITSVTPNATRRFETTGKIFSYTKIKKEAFAGYKIEKQGGLGFYIADAEKAFVDLNYMRMIKNQKPLSRFDKQKIGPMKTIKYASLFKNPKLTAIITRTLK